MRVRPWRALGRRDGRRGGANGLNGGRICGFGGGHWEGLTSRGVVGMGGTGIGFGF